MFATHPQHEFPVPKGLADPGSQHWRLIELVLHLPWYLLTVAAVPEEDEAMLTQTWCLAWETVAKSHGRPCESKANANRFHALGFSEADRR